VIAVEDLKVKDAMTKRIATIGENETVQVAAKTMKQWRVGSLIITNGKNPIGILTESDIIKKVVSKGISAGDVNTKEIMSSPLMFLSPHERLSDAATKMSSGKIRRMPVIKDGEVIGILTHTDIVRMSPAAIDILSERIKMRTGERIFPSEGNTGVCESCGNYSEKLIQVDDEWVCEDCNEEKRST